MKLTKIRIGNFLGISSFVVDNLGKWNVIAGPNGAGKSTVLKAIREGLESSGTMHQLVKVGEETAEIQLTFDNGLHVHRTMSDGKNDVKVFNDDQPVKKPQTYLDALIGKHQMNPIDFMAGSSKARRETILKAIPVTVDESDLLQKQIDFKVTDDLDFSAVDFTQHGFKVLAAAKKIVGQTRTKVNQDIDRLTKSIAQDSLDIPENFDADASRDFDVVKASEELAANRLLIQEHAQDVDKQVAYDEASDEIRDSITKLKARLDRLEADLSHTSSRARELKATVDAFTEPETQSLRDAIKTHSDNEALRNRVASIATRRKEKDVLTPQWSRLHGLHKYLDIDMPKELLAAAELPIDHLELSGDHITFGGVELDNLSTSEQMKLALAIAKVHAGDIKVICIDRWESLDSISKDVLVRTSAGDDFEYLVTVVTDDEALSMESN